MLQGVLELLQIPYTHSGVLASALAMQKDTAKVVMEAAGIRCPKGVTARIATRWRRPMSWSRPMSSSRSPTAPASGIFIVTEEHAHPPQELFRDDWAFGDQMLVEEFIPGQELTCAVMGDRVLGVIEITTANKFYDYDAKYSKGGSNHVLPAPILPIVYQEVRRLTLAAHRALGCRGVSRADFRYDDRIEGTGGLALPRGQHSTRHDRDVPCAGARGLCGHNI